MSKQQSIKGYSVEELECEEIELLAHSCAPDNYDRTDANETVDFSLHLMGDYTDMLRA